MNLIIDIGNTRAKLFVFEENRLIEQTFCDSQTLCALDQLLSKYTFQKGIISSVGHIGEEAENRLKNLPFDIIRLNEKQDSLLSLHISLGEATKSSLSHQQWEQTA